MRVITLGAGFAFAALFVAGSGSPSQDRLALPKAGQRIVFVKGARLGAPEHTYHPTIYLINADGTRATRVAGGDRTTGRPIWSPDGTRFAFHWQNHVYVASADGRRLWRVTRGREPRWSPDGTELVYVHATDVRYGDVYVIRPSGKGRRQLTHNTGDLQFLGEPRWSPNGAVIAFTAYTPGAGTFVYVVSGGGGTPARLAEGTSPEWSPDGVHLLFQGYGAGNACIGVHVMNADGSGQRRLADGFTFESSHPWSPTGSQIAFDGHDVCERIARGIYLIKWDGSDLKAIADRFHSEPTWSPDGRYLVVSRSRDLHVMTAEGRYVRRLTRDAGELDLDPDWQPLAVDLMVTTPGPVGRTPLKYRLTVRNRGTAVARLARLRVQIADGTRVVSLSTTRGSCSVPRITCVLGKFDPNTTAHVVMAIRPRRRGKIRASVSVESAAYEPNKANNSFQVAK